MMKQNSFLRSLGAAAMLLGAASAQAHTGHGAEGFAAGLVHPFMGLDHLLAMVAVGIWSALVLPSTLRLAGPMLFLGLLLVGALSAQAGAVLPPVGWGMAASAAALGALLLLTPAARHSGWLAGLGMVAVVALFLGQAHGAEWAADPSFAVHSAGFLLGSAALHGAGLGAGVALQRLPAWVGRCTTAVLGASGLLLLAARF